MNRDIEWKNMHFDQMEEFKKGEEDFIEALSECPSCLAKVGIEILEMGQIGEDEKKTLKQILLKLVEKEADETQPLIVSRRPLRDLLEGKPILLPNIRTTLRKMVEDLKRS